jgi:uncharacterized protein (DUF488 family)
MKPSGRSILTIGHSTLAFDRFAALLKMHGVTAIADVRSSPYSRFAPQYNRPDLAQSLKASSVHYVFLGQELGARPNDVSCLKDGTVSYQALAQRPIFRQAITRLVLGSEKHRIACLCAEKEPLTCHRALLVGRHLAAEGVAVEHIHADGALEPHDRAMDRLLDLTGVSRQDLFRSRAELLTEALVRQEKKIAYVPEKGGVTDF